MRMELERLELKNFKGIREFIFEPGGGDATIKGKNASGKTSVADGFFWLLLGADSGQRAKFNIIPLAADGNPVNHTVADVAATVKFDGEAVKLRKTYQQIWVKKRGAKREEFSGHQTDHFWDDVPVSKREYESKLAGLIPQKLLRAFLDPNYFCGQTDVKYRRGVLAEVIGAVTDDKVIGKYPELAGVPAILGKHSIEDCKKIILANKKEANAQLKELPLRIDEKRRDLPALDTVTLEELDRQIEGIDAQVAAKNNELAGLSPDGAMAAKQKEITDLMLDLTLAEKAAKDKFLVELEQMGANRDWLMGELAKFKKRASYLEGRIAELDAEAAENKRARDKLAQQYEGVDGEVFAASDTCFNCGQRLPDADIELQEEKFKAHKAQRLKAIDAKGEALYNDYEQRIKPEIIKLNMEQPQLLGKIDDYTRDFKKCETDMILKQEDMQLAVKAAAKQGQARVAQLEAELAAGEVGPQRSAIQQTVDGLFKQRGAVESKRLKLVQTQKVNKRIGQLEKWLKDSAAAVEQAEGKLYLLELFSRKKAEFIEQAVNGKFKITSWRLFEEQVNGGLREVCEAMLDGVPYSTDLNTGARVNVGLDVINTLSGHYKIYCPVFIDNAESVTDFIPLTNQIIKLFAIDGLDTLEVSDGA